MTPWGLHLRQVDRRAARAKRVYEAGMIEASPPVQSRHEEIISFLRARGVDEDELRWGSIPASALSYIASTVFERLPSQRPVRALHIGNFVGVSLCFISLLVRERHAESVVVSIDPNITHRSVQNPQAHVLALLHRFDLLGNSLIIPGYTLEWTVGEWGAESGGLACAHVLASLERVCAGPFDLVLLDGNHDESYLERELRALRGLLADGSILVFDDVVDWAGVARAFGRAADDDHFKSLGQDGRVGILQLSEAPIRV
jgi:hypothetical protein